MTSFRHKVKRRNFPPQLEFKFRPRLNLFVKSSCRNWKKKKLTYPILPRSIQVMVIWAQDRRANKRSAPFPAPYQSTTASSAFTESQDGLPATKIKRTSVFDRLESTIPMVTSPEDGHIARRYFRNRARKGRKERST